MEHIISQLILTLNLSALAGLDESGPPTGSGGNGEVGQRPLVAAAGPSSSLGAVLGKYGAQEFPPGDTFISSLAAWASTSPASALAFSLVVGCIAYDGVVWLARRRKALRRIKQFIWQAVLPVGCFILPSWLLQNLVSSLASHDGSLILPTSSFCLALVFNTLSEELKTYGVPYISLVLARLIHAIWVVSAIRMALGGLCGLSADPSIIGLLRFGTLVFASVVVVHLFLEWIHQATTRMADSQWRDEEYLILDFIGELDTSSDRSEDDVDFFADESIQESTSVVDLRDLDIHLSDEEDFFDCSLIKEEARATGSPFFTPETGVLDDVGMPSLMDAFPAPKTRVDDSFEDMKISALKEDSSTESIGGFISVEYSRLSSEGESLCTAIVDVDASPIPSEDIKEQDQSVDDLFYEPMFELHLDEDFKNLNNDTLAHESEVTKEEDLWIYAANNGVSQEHSRLNPNDESRKSSLAEEETIALDGPLFTGFDEVEEVPSVGAVTTTIFCEDDHKEDSNADIMTRKDIEDSWPIYSALKSLEAVNVDALAGGAENGARNDASTDPADGYLSPEDRSIKVEEKTVASNDLSFIPSISGLDDVARPIFADIAASSIPCENDQYDDKATDILDGRTVFETILKDLRAKIARLEEENAQFKANATRTQASAVASSNVEQVKSLLDVREDRIQPVKTGSGQDGSVISSQVTLPASEDILELSDHNGLQKNPVMPSQVERFALPAFGGGPELGDASRSQKMPAIPSQVEYVALPAPEDDLKLGDASRSQEDPALCNSVEQVSPFREALGGSPELEDANHLQDVSAPSSNASEFESCSPTHEEGLEHADASPAPANSSAFSNINVQVKSCPPAFEDQREPANMNPTPIPSLPPCDLAEVHPSPPVTEDGPSPSSCAPPVDTEDEYRSVTEISYASCFAGEVRAIFVSDGVYGGSEPAGRWTQQSVCLYSSVTEERNKLLEQDRHIVEAIRADEQVCDGTGPGTDERNDQDGIPDAYEEWNDLLEEAGLIPKAAWIDEWDSDGYDLDACEESNRLLKQAESIPQATRMDEHDSDNNDLVGDKTESSVVTELREDLELCEGRLRLSHVAFDWCDKDRSRFKRKVDDLLFFLEATRTTLIAEIRKYQDKVATVERSNLASVEALEAAEESIDFLVAENYFAQVASDEQVRKLRADNAALVAELRACNHRLELYENASEGTEDGSGDLDCDNEYPAGSLEDCQARLALCQAALSWQEDNRRRYKAKNEGLRRVKKQDKLTKQAFTEEVKKQIAKNFTLERDKRAAAQSLEAAEGSIDFLQAENFFERQAFQQRILELEDGLAGKDKEVNQLVGELERWGHSHELNAGAHAQWNAILIKDEIDIPNSDPSSVTSGVDKCSYGSPEPPPTVSASMTSISHDIDKYVQGPQDISAGT
ncbi:uncharacterized protein LAESUDRAFT_762715 [Laetiporus sulphureus 93-53]|uniref:Uncharacterized protein n=1 Tax=Laetiporus sulphureus 93-53 TaxID=1314785 RepID=A0A165CD24_9APHY|nr:uncharacterized protein LAESUDRAFT_762715 [Laetiporus sulphureus 93-53]KZT02592.1 hypothetical protein LAESUDRAFT_762715 [Laetiporus sulphureus 93-53]